MGEFWNWLTNTNQGLAARIAGGVIIFSIWAYVEFIRKGKKASRWKEYLFLIYCVLIVMAFGMINDQLTVSISWEYFVHGKGFDLQGQDQPDWVSLRLWACEVGAKATWTAGLLLGAVLLICNNPNNKPPVVPLKKLVKLVWLIGIPACVLAVLLGIAGYLGAWKNLTEDFSLIWQSNIYRPANFQCVWGMHLGAYVGGGIGTAVLCWWILKKRFARYHNEKMKLQTDSDSVRMQP